jgi:hypothetical protein
MPDGDLDGDDPSIRRRASRAFSNGRTKERSDRTSRIRFPLDAFKDRDARDVERSDHRRMRPASVDTFSPSTNSWSTV